MFNYETLRGSEPEARQFFKDNGFIHIKNVFDEITCNDAIKAIAEIECTIEPSNSIGVVTETINNTVCVKYFQDIYAKHSAFRKFFCLKLMNISSMLLETNELFFADLEAHIRNPGGGEIPKHQDNFYFNLSKASGLTAYIALSSHDKDSGGLNYLSKSHDEVLEHSLSKCAGFSSFIDNTMFVAKSSKGQNIYSPIYCQGDISIHHPNNIHWSKPSPFDAKRGYALSARVFDSEESINEESKKRYLQLLSQNRK